MQAFVTEELIWALHRERVEDARRIWLASRVPTGSRDEGRANGGPRHWVPLKLRPAGGR